jgi:hypothetical protein
MANLDTIQAALNQIEGRAAVMPADMPLLIETGAVRARSPTLPYIVKVYT